MLRLISRVAHIATDKAAALHDWQDIGFWSA
jgi:hypothetical protein